MARKGTPKRTLTVTPPPSNQSGGFQVSPRPKLITQIPRSPLRENSSSGGMSLSNRGLASNPQVSIIERTKPPSLQLTGVSKIPRSGVPVTSPVTRDSTSHHLVINVSDRPKATELATIRGFNRTRPEGVSISGGINRVTPRPLGISFLSKRVGGVQSPENSEPEGRKRLTRGIRDHAVLRVSDL